MEQVYREGVLQESEKQGGGVKYVRFKREVIFVRFKGVVIFVRFKAGGGGQKELRIISILGLRIIRVYGLRIILN